MTVLMLSCTVLLMCVRTRDTMHNSKLVKEVIEIVVFTVPIGLHMNNFMVKQAFDMRLQLQENIKHIKFALKKLEPGETTVSINKTDIVIMTTNRSLGMAPYIRKHKLKQFVD